MLARIVRAPWVGALLLAACAGGGAPSNPDAGSVDPVAPVAPTILTSHEREALARGVTALSIDDRGVPRFARAIRALPGPTGASFEKAALAHLAALAPAYVDGGAICDVKVAATHAVGKGAIVALRQEVGGVEVLDGEVRVLVDGAGALLAIAGTPRSPAAANKTFTLSAAEALAAAVHDRFQLPADAGDVIRRGRQGAWHDLTMRPRADLTIGATHAKQVWFPDGDVLIAAWQVEGYGASAADPQAAFGAVIAADDGRVLDRRDLTAADAYSYRVWADDDAAGRPFEGPQESFAPHPAGAPNGTQPAFVAPNLVDMDAFNRHTDPWLPASATQTLGNNVDAYLDKLDAADGFTAGVDFRASTTAPGTFDRTFDVTKDAAFSTDQQMAGITQLFYTVNWLHDWYYDSGFDETAGNAQADNFGRGGFGGDVLHAEAQDDVDGGSNGNANMSTPSDGLSPRMQMFVWNGVGSKSLSTSAGGTVASIQAAAFGPLDFDVETDAILVVDGTAPVNDGCQAFTNTVTGKIVVIDRGLCTFESKVLRAQQAGAAGVLIVNNVATGLPSMGNDAAVNGVTIPSLGITQADGNALKAALAGGPTTAHLIRHEPRRDGDLDVTVISHEWGHYLHHRLTNCSGAQCGAMSEGWGDFVALHGQLRPGDDPHAVYPLAVYDTITLADAYYGIRRVPYSTNRTKNDLSFRHLAATATLPTTSPPMLTFGSNAEVHNAGEVWATTLWDAYVALIDAHDYDTARRAMSDYVVAGLLLTPANGTFTETRDAILAATAAIDADDALVLAGAFSARGMGTCAKSPTDTNFNTVVEMVGLAGRLELGAVTLDDDGVSCDHDGIIDAGETAHVTVQVVNAGAAPLDAADVTLSTAAEGVTITDATIRAPAMGPWSQTTVTFEVRYDPDVTGRTSIQLDVSATDAAACNAPPAATKAFAADFDDDEGVSATDTADSAHAAWLLTGIASTSTWRREVIAGDLAWHGLDNGFASDTAMESPVLQVSATDDFVVDFDHKYGFEFDGTVWDGGVIELSTDGGTTWADVTTFGAAPGYTHTINGNSGNVLQGKPVFGGTNPASPARNHVTLDFGTALAGQSVQLRFRIGTDASAAAYGWELDNLVFAGIDNTPFGAVSDEDPTCQAGPDANAGVDRTVHPADHVVLDGTGSIDPNGDPLIYAWTQIGGVHVTLTDPTSATPNFTAPHGSVDLRLTFRLVVADWWAEDSDTVVYTIDVDNTPPPPPDAMPAPDAASPPDAAPDAASPPEADAEPAPDAAPPAEEGDDGGCCSTGGDGLPSAGVLALAALAFTLRRRRR